jgi:hypothetical protein
MHANGMLAGVSWLIQENEVLKNGVPDVCRVAVLLGRKSDNPFMMNMDITAETSGISFESAFAKSLNRGRASSHIFDPLGPQFGTFEVNKNNLGRLIDENIEKILFPVPQEPPGLGEIEPATSKQDIPQELENEAPEDVKLDAPDEPEQIAPQKPEIPGSEPGPDPVTEVPEKVANSASHTNGRLPAKRLTGDRRYQAR